MQAPIEAPSALHTPPVASPTLGRLSAVACWVVPALALLVGVLRLKLGWDDGAITAAFARTFAQTGRWALTPVSEQVEGFSSLLWAAVLALGNVLGAHSPAAMLLWSKVGSALAFFFALLLFRGLSRRFLPRVYADCSVLLLALTATPSHEVMNGMEMNFYMLLTLALLRVLLSERVMGAGRWAVAALLSFALLLTRFEAPYLLFFLFAGLLWAGRHRAGVMVVAALDLCFFLGMEVWRHRTFGLWLPNTIVAKRWFPYSPAGMAGMLHSRLSASAEPVLLFAAPLLLVLAVVLARWVQGERRTLLPKRVAGEWRVVASMTAGALLLGLLMGKNLGHPGRMILGFLPFLVLAIVAAFRAIAPASAIGRTRLLAALLAGQSLVWLGVMSRIARGNLVPYASVEHLGLAADQVRTLLGKDQLRVSLSDVGGSALCCEKLQILDAALLANQYLAGHGFGAAQAYLQEQRPELIETHQPWATLNRMYTTPALDGYGLLEVQGFYFYLRRDLYASLLARGYHESGAGLAGEPCVTPYEGAVLRPIDLQFLLTRSRCIVVSKRYTGAAPDPKPEDAE